MTDQIDSADQRTKLRKTPEAIAKRRATIEERSNRRWRDQTDRIVNAEAKRAGVPAFDVFQHLNPLVSERGYCTAWRRRVLIRAAVRDAQNR